MYTLMDATKTWYNLLKLDTTYLLLVYNMLVWKVTLIYLIHIIESDQRVNAQVVYIFL